jgi:hypothetical protein
LAIGRLPAPPGRGRQDTTPPEPWTELEAVAAASVGPGSGGDATSTLGAPNPSGGALHAEVSAVGGDGAYECLNLGFGFDCSPGLGGNAHASGGLGNTYYDAVFGAVDADGPVPLALSWQLGLGEDATASAFALDFALIGQAVPEPELSALAGLIFALTALCAARQSLRSRPVRARLRLTA